MKKIIFISLAAASMVSAPAFGADGVVNVSGTVAAKCSTTAGSPQNMPLGELAATDGTLDTALPNAGGAANLTKAFSIKCTSAAPNISVTATPLVITGQTATGGYTDTVHYTATAVADKAGTGTSPNAVFTTDAGTNPNSSQAVGGHLANTSNNVRVTLSLPHTTAPTDLLFAGSYAGTMTVTISPI